MPNSVGLATQFGFLRFIGRLWMKWPKYRCTEGSQQRWSKCQASQQRHQQTQSDGGPAAAELAKVRKEHHAKSNDRRERTRGQRIANARQCSRNRSSVCLSFAQAFAKPRDQEQTEVCPRPEQNNDNKNLRRLEDFERPPLVSWCVGQRSEHRQKIDRNGQRDADGD